MARERESGISVRAARHDDDDLFVSSHLSIYLSMHLEWCNGLQAILVSLGAPFKRLSITFNRKAFCLFDCLCLMAYQLL